MFRSLVALQVPRRCQDGLFAFVMHVQTNFRAHGTAECAQVIGNMSDAIVSIFACRIWVSSVKASFGLDWSCHGQTCETWPG